MTFFLAAAFGALIATGILHAVLGLRPPFAHVHLAFALTAVCLSAFIFIQFRVYRCGSVDEAIELARGQGRVVAPLFFAFAWFVRESLGLPRWPRRTAVYVVFLLSVLIYDELSTYGLYFATRPTLLKSTWFGEELNVFGAPLGFVQAMWFLVGLLVLGSIPIAGVGLVRRGSKLRGLCLIVGGSLLFAAFGLDSIHELVGGTWPFVTEFAMAIFSILMSIALAVDVRAQELELTRLASAALIVRDKLNTPLQALAVGHELLAKGRPPTELVPMLRRATRQLSELGRMLRAEKASAALVRGVITPPSPSKTATTT